jgi:cytochrome c
MSLLRSICLLCTAAWVAGPAYGAVYDPGRFEKEIVVAACRDPMQMEITRDGRVFFIERNGTLNLKHPNSAAVTVLGQRPVHLTGEIGMLGLALDRDFERSQALFLFFSPLEKTGTLRLSRFLLKGDKLDLESERMLLEYSLERPNLQHQGGGLFMAANGDLILGTGDNTTTIPQIQLDERPGFVTHDAQRTSANSMDLRGKILRIQPTEDGGYLIPKDNLFADGKAGRPEIFVMGVRNGFRQYVDDQTGYIYWGDVGQNIDESIGAGPNGYDEINQARGPGFYGWPYFTGPNEPYRKFDFVSRKAGAFFDASAPRNDSPNNTGARELRPPQPAFIWYPSGESQVFPSLGSGGRSALVGPLYRYDPKIRNELKLPAALDHVLFIHDWMRNWIQCVHLDGDERIARIEPFLPGIRFRKPIELKLGPDHTLYVIETGDQWNGNVDSQITRWVYRSGNRPPVAVPDASNVAGKVPLRIKFDAARSSDKDGDPLRYAWRFGDRGESSDVAPEFTFKQPGRVPVTLTVTDSAGAKNSARIEITAGNSAPRLEFVGPTHGGFYDGESAVPYRLSVADEEDGTIVESRVTVEATTRARASATQDISPTRQLMHAMTCFGCHTISGKSIGPAYLEIANRYRGDRAATETLARKIIAGGVGAWGQEAPMPPHPQVSLDQARQMVGWILSLSGNIIETRTGLAGTFIAPKAKLDRALFPAVLALQASYTDNGFDGLPALRTTREIILHPRHKRAAAFDRAAGADIIDVFEPRYGNVVRLSPEGWFAFDPINLAEIGDVAVHLVPLTSGTVEVEVRLDSPHGERVGSGTAQRTGGAGRSVCEIVIPMARRAGARALHFFARVDRAGAPGPVADVHWVEFKRRD